MGEGVTESKFREWGTPSVGVTRVGVVRLRTPKL